MLKEFEKSIRVTPESIFIIIITISYISIVIFKLQFKENSQVLQFLILFNIKQSNYSLAYAKYIDKKY